MATTFSTIYTAVSNRCRIPVTNTTELAKIKVIINERYREICAQEEWTWLDKRYVFNTASAFSHGTISCYAGSTRFDLTNIATGIGSLAGRKMVVPTGTPDSRATFRIASHLATDTIGAFDVAWTNNSIATNVAAFHAYQDEYDLPTDFLSPIDLQRYGYHIAAEPIGARDMLALKGNTQRVGKPQYWSIIDFDTTGDPSTQRQLWLYPYPDKRYRTEIYYRRQATELILDSDAPAMPEEYRHVLTDGATAKVYSVMLADETRGQMYEAYFQRGLAQMAQQNREKTRQKPQMTPRESWRGYFKRRRRFTGAGVDLGSEFDRWTGE